MLSLAVTLLVWAAPPKKSPEPEPVKQSLPQPASAGLPSLEQLQAVRERAYRELATQEFPGDDGGIKARLLQGDLSDAIAMFMTGDGGSSTPRYVWKVPDLQYYIDVPGVQVVNGLPVRFSAAVSAARPTFLIKYYIEEFERAGLYIPPAAHQFEPAPPVIQVTALDTDSLTSYTVILQVVDEKHTTVIMSQGYLQPWLKKKRGPAAEPDFAPLFPQADHVVRSKTEGMDLIQYTTRSEPSAVKGFYRDVMTRAGYEQKSSGLFVRGTEAIRVSAIRTEARQETGVLLERRLLPGESGGELAP